MSKVIEFRTSSQMQAEILRLEQEVRDLKVRQTQVSAVNSLLQFQIHEMRSQIDNVRATLNLMDRNLQNLEDKLPSPG